MVIPMDTTPTTQAPSGLVTRARARAIQSEVTSLLLEFSPSSSETWLLPKSEILCVIRYNAQDSEPRTVEEETGVNTLDSPEPPTRARNLRPEPGTSGPWTFRPTRSFRPPMTSTSPGVPTLGLARTPSQTFRRPEPPACPDLPPPGCQHISTAPTL